jgi:thiamine pyrophosphate-dependent acetolactate synthase large subunit-like protein
MDQNTTNTIAGIFRAFAAIIPMLVLTGTLSKDTADQLNALLPRFDEVLFGASGLVAVLMAAWSVYSNRSKAVVTQAAQVKGVVVAVSREAPGPVQDVAADPAHPDVVSAPIKDKEPPK